MELVKGVVAAVKNNGAMSGEYGISHKVGICVDNVWYSTFTKQPPEAIGLVSGKQVEFIYNQKGNFKNIQPKSLKITDAPVSAPAVSTAPTASFTPAAAPATKVWAGEKGVKIGHALNNAVLLACHEGVITTDNIEKRAIQILHLSEKLNGNYDKIVSGVQEALKPVVSPEQAHTDSLVKAKPAVVKNKPAVVEEEPAFDDEPPFG